MKSDFNWRDFLIGCVAVTVAFLLGAVASGVFVGIALKASRAIAGWP